MADHAQNGINRPSIIICDESALFFHLHTDVSAYNSAPLRPLREFSLTEGYASSAWELSNFNTQHPLFGGEPVTVLVPDRNLRMITGGVMGKLCTAQLPPYSAIELRDNLYVASPEFVLARMACGRSEACASETAMNLCARYYITPSGEIENRASFLTTPVKLQDYLDSAPQLRGSRKAARALRWVLPNSGSPMETKTALLFRLPLAKGGFALPFDALNYDVRAGRWSGLCEQGLYCIDMVSRLMKIGVEYDGWAYHLDKSADSRRRNALLALGWEVFPMDKSILHDADATEKLGYQVAKRMGIRIRKPKCWESKHAQLRNDLGLPT